MYSKYKEIESRCIWYIPAQVGRGPQAPLAIQVAIAVVTPGETSYPLTQV